MNFYPEKGIYAEHNPADFKQGFSVKQSELPKYQKPLYGNKLLGKDDGWMPDIEKSLKELIKTVDTTLDDTAIMVIVVAFAVLVGFMSSK